MASPPLSNITDIGYKIRNMIATDETIAKLLTNSTEIVEPDDLIDTWIFDYDYVDKLTTKSGCYVMIDVNSYDLGNTNMMGIIVSIFVMCHKPFMKIPPDILPGFKGSRRDNVAHRIDEIIRSQETFGVGSIVLTDYETTTAPDEYSCKVLLYNCADFLRKPRR